MEWQGWSNQLVQVLGLSRTPVGVSYVDRPPAGAERPKCRICSGLYEAAEGKTLLFNAQNSGCPGGTMFMGFQPQQTPEQAVKLRSFLINGEKLFSCPAAIYRSQKTGPPLPTAMAQYALFAPLDRMTVRPDVTAIMCNAWQASRLVNLAWYETGEAMHCDPTGALCRSVISYPLVTNRVNVSFGDVTARRSEKMSENELFVTLPWVHLRSVVASLFASSAGTADVDLSDLPTGE